jgi:hypothetical protein
MYEIRPRIVANASPLQRHGNTLHRRSAGARKANIHGFTHDMQAVFGNLSTLLMQLVIRRGRTIARNNVEGLSRLQSCPHSKEEIEEIRVDGPDLVDSIIAQEMIDLSERLYHVLPLDPVDRFQTFAGMRIIKGQEFFRGTAEMSKDGTR